MTSSKTLWRACAWACVLVLASCGDGSGGGGGDADAGTDARRPEGSPDASADAPGDGSGGGRDDAGPDAGTGDAGADGGGGMVGPRLPRHNADSPLGINLTRASDYLPSWPFVDLFKLSRPWISGTSSVWNDERPLDLDENGWVRSLRPGQIARTVVRANVSVPLPRSGYVVLYEGTGRIEYDVAARLVEESSRPGRHVVDYDSSRGAFIINLLETDPSDPIRNIRVIVPGGVCDNDGYRYCDEERPCEGGARCVPFEENYEAQRFHPQFLDSIKTYRLLRFMNWMRTNDSEISTWEQRPRLSDARWWEKGVPLEVMVDLANRLGAEPWFCIPHLADEDYIRNFATYVRDHLDPSLRAWVEHSNEVWNGTFAQSRYAQEQGTALGLSDDPNRARLFWHARRTATIARIFTEVFGGTDRLVRLAAAQAANSWSSRQILEFEETASVVDALAIAPYFGGYLGRGDTAAEVRNLTLDQLFERLRTEALPRARQWMVDQKAVADEFGVQLVAYEAGQHLVGAGPRRNDEQLQALFTAANRDPRMGELYATYLQDWRDSGGALMVPYTHVYACSRFGCWGSLEYLTQPRDEAPKFDALQTFIETTSPWW